MPEDDKHLSQLNVWLWYKWTLTEVMVFTRVLWPARETGHLCLRFSC